MASLKASCELFGLQFNRGELDTNRGKGRRGNKEVSTNLVQWLQCSTKIH